MTAYDHDAHVTLDHLQSLPECNGRLGAIGICIGGHLSFRRAMNPEHVGGRVFYATDIHKRSPG